MDWLKYPCFIICLLISCLISYISANSWLFYDIDEEPPVPAAAVPAAAPQSLPYMVPANTGQSPSLPQRNSAPQPQQYGQQVLGNYAPVYSPAPAPPPAPKQQQRYSQVSQSSSGGNSAPEDVLSKPQSSKYFADEKIYKQNNPSGKSDWLFQKSSEEEQRQHQREIQENEADNQQRLLSKHLERQKAEAERRELERQAELRKSAEKKKAIPAPKAKIAIRETAAPNKYFADERIYKQNIPSKPVDGPSQGSGWLFQEASDEQMKQHQQEIRENEEDNRLRVAEFERRQFEKKAEAVMKEREKQAEMQRFQEFYQNMKQNEKPPPPPPAQEHHHNRVHAPRASKLKSHRKHDEGEQAGNEPGQRFSMNSLQSYFSSGYKVGIRFNLIIICILESLRVIRINY